MPCRVLFVPVFTDGVYSLVPIEGIQTREYRVSAGIVYQIMGNFFESSPKKFHTSGLWTW